MKLFITGTDTGAGKTFVTAALARRARANGERVFAFKPVETGCSGPLGDDQRLLVEAAGGWQSGELAGLYSLVDAVTPSVAARRQRIELDVERMIRIAQQTAATVAHAFVEGAGGWRAPLTDSLDMAALARRLGFPVVLVAKATLGTINHTLLTAEAIERDGARLAAIVLSKRPQDDEVLAASNAEELRARRREPLIVLGTDDRALDRLLRST